MLNVPESIKTLYKTDGVRKNFRVHFPNGEMEDITNEHIVRESLHFTESVCSQSVFRFGLAEASVIEFETVGVGNMFGMTIECSIEIDTTSLSAAEISAIQSGTWDGSLVIASESDIGFGFFRIPLGLFRVDKCPRNHGAMTHRQVTAYSVGLAENSITSSFERWKKNAEWRYETQVYNLPDLLNANLYSRKSIFDDVISSKYKTTGVSRESTTTSGQFTTLRVPDGTLNFTFNNMTMVRSSATALPHLYYASTNETREHYTSDFDNAEAKAFIEETLTSFGLASYVDDAYYAIRRFLNVTATSVSLYDSSVGYPIAKSEIIYLPDDNPAIVEAPTAYTLVIKFVPNAGQQRTASRAVTLSTSGIPFRLWQLTPREPQEFSITVAASGETTPPGGATRYTYSLSYSIADLLRGWLELAGEFGTENRGKGFEKFALSAENPIEIIPGNYDEMWWDEYDVDPIGTVSIAFKNGDDEVTASVFLGNGSSIYDMSDNEALKMLDGLTLDGISELLNGEFAQNAEKVGFTPTEITMQGWPWLEAGDALRITAEDGTVVNTYALRVEFSGIQNMMSDIISEGGEIVGEV